MALWRHGVFGCPGWSPADIAHTRVCGHATTMCAAETGARIALMDATVLIVDDHDDFRGAARRLLEAGGLTVVGEAGDLASARVAVREMRPSLVLLDIQLPDGDGIAASYELRHWGASVILISSRDESAYGTRVSASPARGFIRKSDLSASRLMSMLRDSP